MDYRYLGRSALQVSPLCLGAMTFGGTTDEATSKRIVDKARDQSINFIDTADVYNGGKSEEVVGRAIRDHRDHWIVATKFGQRAGQRPNETGQSRKWIEDEFAIRHILVEYARALDDRNFDAYVALFAKDGEWTNGKEVSDRQSRHAAPRGMGGDHGCPEESTNRRGAIQRYSITRRLAPVPMFTASVHPIEGKRI